ncbi:hypothetical protein M378DRAFT_120386 [Amanita muscaria Koide BX008]|uniref:Conidiation-specific protein 6 n=1 Tax=Amanita muscaria (strain Koide BX008) TaxID=946122 RepID=A0A0C2XG12_AMAMK|nr:hypothetical protein M378DRAFT_120386 [Amanita muscaria Koide BX008]
MLTCFLEHEKNSERVARGLKASIHNPRVSPEAKAHAEERLHEMGYEIEPDKDSGPTPAHSKHEARVLGGYKATLSKKGVSEEAKRHARQVLEEHEAI